MFETYDITAGRRHCVTGSLRIASEMVAAIAQSRGPAALYRVERCRAPIPDEPTAAAPDLQVSGDLDGFALSFDAGEVIFFPTYAGAAAAYRAAREGQAALAACLVMAPGRGGRCHG
jgi:hypothetical protein